MSKFEKIYNEYIEKPVLKIDDKVIDLYVDREDFLHLLEYGKQLEQVLDKIKEKVKELDRFDPCGSMAVSMQISYFQEDLERLLEEIE